ncbi:MAG TPA: hypothetical protein VMA35_04610, partial [Candidatus Sulfopaludibacter sp.]|nr:hypothetical protein [Candidatus Sulfopaludibacter sp.]
NPVKPKATAIPFTLQCSANPAVMIETRLELDQALHKAELDCISQRPIIVSLYAHGHQLGIGLGLSDTDRGQVRFWCGTVVPSSKRLADSCELLGKDARQVFPVQFESGVELVGGPVKGSVPGFLVLEDFQTWRTRTVT